MVLFHIGLFFHMIGIMIASGGSIGAILTERLLWKSIDNRSANAGELVIGLQNSTRIILIGLVVFILSGLTMLYALNWILLKNPWFDAKLFCFMLLPLRGFFFFISTVSRLRCELEGENYNLPELMKMKWTMKRFHLIQFVLVATIIFLVIFKV